jgi:hypothetical protein
MPDSKITDLSAIVSVVDVDVLPIVDISDDTTKKVTIAQIKATAPVQSVNGSTGAVSVQPTLVSGTNIKTINDESILGSGNITISGGGGITDGDKGDITVSDSGATWTIDNGVVTDAKVASGIDAAKIADGTVSNAEYQYLGGVTSDIQTQLNAKEATITAGTTGQYYRGDKSFQTLDKAAVGLSNVDNTSDANKPVSTATQTALDGKQATITGAATTIDTEDLTASRALVSDGSGKVAVSDVTSTELSYLDGVTSAVQTQINSKISTYDGTTYDVTALAAVTQAEYDALTPSATTLYFII